MVETGDGASPQRRCDHLEPPPDLYHDESIRFSKRKHHYFIRNRCHSNQHPFLV